MTDNLVRVTVEPGGPVVIHSAVEIRTDDGLEVTSDRVAVAVCTCRRSKTYPLCDTSHRRTERRTSSP